MFSLPEFKKDFLQFLIQELRKDLSQLTKIAEDARTEAISSEMKQEGKFDTRAIEAGYLASAQAKRISDLGQEIIQIQKINLDSSSEISIGSLVKVMELNESKYYFLLPITGGKSYEFQKRKVVIVSPNSPLGQNLLGKSELEEIETPKPMKILGIL